MTTGPVGPALTSEEWTNRRIEHRWLDATGGTGTIVRYRHGPVGLIIEVDPGRGTSSVVVPNASVQALAALCLYSQRFGFTREDVAVIRSVVDADYDGMDLDYWTRGAAIPSPASALRALASRIAALLPPDEPLLNKPVISASYLFANGMVATFDRYGHQMPEYQGHAKDVWGKVLRDAPDGATINQDVEPR